MHGTTVKIIDTSRTLLSVMKGKVVPFHAMMAYWRNRSTVPLILNLGNEWRSLF